MLKTAISTMPIFSMTCFKIPCKVIKAFLQRMQKFLWNGAQDYDEILRIAWDIICKPKGGDRVGLRDWKLLNEAMG